MSFQVFTFFHCLVFIDGQLFIISMKTSTLFKILLQGEIKVKIIVILWIWLQGLIIQLTLFE
jgi:hypothetical protein